MAIQKTAVVIVSHYNAWPTDQLVKLLDQMRTIPAGYPFSVRVVVNQAENKSLELPDRHADVAVFYRENTGYNIGAWEFGWRQEPRADYYLFLQEECLLVKPNWLGVFIQAVNRTQVGIVGEIIGFHNTTWEDFKDTATRYHWDLSPNDCLDFIAKQGIQAGEMADHLQSLVLCLRREVLETIGGFRLGITKEEAIASEIGISKSVQAIGLKIRQVKLRPFQYIHHPQWEERRREANQPIWMLRRLASLSLLGGFQRKRRERDRRRRGDSPTGSTPSNPQTQTQTQAVQSDSTA